MYLCYVYIIQVWMHGYNRRLWSVSFTTWFNTFVYNNYSSYASVTNMLQNLNWPPLAHCRNQLKAITMFKIMHQLIDIPADTILIPAPSNYSLRGHSMRLLQPNTRVNSYLNSFFPSSIKIWNNLPNDFITCSSLDQFKARLAEHQLTT